MHTARKSAFLGFAALAALGMAAPAAQAQTAYVDSYDGMAKVDIFGTLSLQTGTFAPIGTLSTELYALGFGANGTLYGLAPDGALGTELYQIATDTGAETPLQDFAGFDLYGGSGNADGTFTAVTAPNSAGRSSLFTVDPVAQTTTAGTQTFASADGLAVSDGSGNVYVSDTTATGTNTDGLDLINTAAKHPGTAFLGDTGLAQVYTGLFSGGQLYTFAYDPNSVDELEGVYTLSTDTGAATFVATTSNDQSILAAALAPAAVPEASTTISFGLLLTLGGLAVAVKRRKTRAAA